MTLGMLVFIIVVVVTIVGSIFYYRKNDYYKNGLFDFLFIVLWVIVGVGTIVILVNQVDWTIKVI